MISDALIAQLKVDEGFRAKAYKCTEGFWTIGYGYNLDANELDLPPLHIATLKKSGIDHALAHKLLIDVLKQREKALQDALPWLSKLNQTRRDVFMNMSYQLGQEGFLKFKRTLAAAERGDYDDCAAFMLKSLWAKQTPNRARRLAKKMQLGY